MVKWEGGCIMRKEKVVKLDVYSLPSSFGLHIRHQEGVENVHPVT